MSAVPAVLRVLHDGERALERELLATAGRHPAEHEVHHVATDLARWSHEHAERIARAAEPHGLHWPEPAADASHDGRPGLPLMSERPARPGGEPAGPDLGLLDDLRGLHLAATDNSLSWEMLAQAAQATGDGDLLALASTCHPQTLRQLRWTNTMLKTLAPQLITSANGSS
ncbi:hypothetical protein [Streptomyces sp. NPDC093568]|uniref:hypothetical protein n=1 Tax=Streptomyces sp. NPDC093568 TaxID=3366041 RepID=UPI00382FC7ED